MHSIKRKWICGFWHVRIVLMTVVLLFGVSGITDAFEIPTGIDGVRLRWDNSFRYNYGVRIKDADPAIINAPNFDDGNRNFPNKGSIVTNRLDLLSEMDLVYKRDYGFRVSGAFWYDHAYDSLSGRNRPFSNHLENGVPSVGLSDYTKRYFLGPDGELLDAFIFGRLNLGPIPINFKAGRHCVYFGEALFAGGIMNGISYSQGPIDLAKALAVPGAEAKELFRPLWSVSVQSQVLPTVSIVGQYFFEWEANRFSEAGSYLSYNDALAYGGEFIWLGATQVLHAEDTEPKGGKDYGVAVHWGPRWMGGGRIGIYWRHFTDKMPQVHLNTSTFRYYFAYADDIDLYGISFIKEIFGWSCGLEYSYRENMPLSSSTITVPIYVAGGDTRGARGDTQHVNFNFMRIFPGSPVYDTATLTGEIYYSRWDRVTQGENFFKGRSGYNTIDKVTKNAWAFAFGFTPTWYQVMEGWNLTMPISFNFGLSGNAATLAGTTSNAGSSSIGFNAIAFQKYNFNLAYIKYFGDFDVNEAGVATANRGGNALLTDRDWVSFTFKVTF